MIFVSYFFFWRFGFIFIVLGLGEDDRSSTFWVFCYIGRKKDN